MHFLQCGRSLSHYRARMLTTRSNRYNRHRLTLILRLLHVLQPLYLPGTPTILTVYIMRRDAGGDSDNIWMQSIAERVSMVGVVWLLWGDGSEGYLGTGIKVRGKVLWGLRSVCHLVLAWHCSPPLRDASRPKICHFTASEHDFLPPLPNHEKPRLEWL